MIAVSDAYKELMASNVRPKSEPVIKISGKDNTGEDITLEWRGKDIKNMTFKWEIDPAGRSAPFMELTWTEILKDKLNAEGDPIKYNNLVKYMEVTLSLVQNMSWYNTWKLIKNNGKSWKNIAAMTWQQVKKQILQEEVTMPKLFLSARPVVEGTTIKWTAKDILSIAANDSKIKEFDGTDNDIPFVNPICYFLLNLRGAFLNSKAVFESLTKSAINISEYDYGTFDKQVIFDNSAKNNILNYCNLRNLHLNFKENYLTLTGISSEHSGYVFSKKVLSSYPTITNGTNISNYSFKNYVAEIIPDDEYQVSPKIIPMENLDKSANLYEFTFKKYGKVLNRIIDSAGNITETDMVSEINRYWEVKESIPTGIFIRPVNINSFDNNLINNKEGENYVEDNPVNPYNVNSNEAQVRFEFLKNYFNADCSILEFNGLANPSIETGDIVSVETNLYTNNGNENRVTKNAIVVSLELSYNGALKEKIIAHEVKS